MRLFIKNPENKLLAAREFKLRPEYSVPQYFMLALLWTLMIPVAIPVYFIGKILLGILMTSGQMAFFLQDKLLGRLASRFDYTFQCFRAYINNRLANSVPHINSSFRRFLFRLSGVRIGRGGFIGMNGYMDDMSSQNVIIEDNVICSFEVTFIAHGAKRDKDGDEKHIIVRKGAYIGARSIILPGVEIGEGAVVGAGSVITKDVPPGAIVAGCPARFMRYTDNYLKRQQEQAGQQ